ncbi:MULTISPECIES: hypothetical protein [Bacillus]|uniref:GGDEF domain-containing protein n=1 Tax=Bacillus infantis TaxID=324767 RepID=A0A5D4SMB2_9BACI|nr:MULTISPECIES: hypothetical protein [Bacillus]PLR74260.1 hypothetical protein CYJ37_01105 [Bacillus sp. UMB0728]TYS63318.1 hypothetical protein FZD47_16900 [Bacillus infantis]
MKNSHFIDYGTEIIIGIVGPEALKKEMLKALEAFPNFKPVFLEATSSTIEQGILSSLISQVEVLLFTEFPCYSKAKQLVNFPIPAQYVPLMGTGLYRSLFLIKTHNEFNHFSIDTVEEKYIQRILFELKADKYEWKSYLPDYDHPESIESIIAFHQENHEKFDSIAITGILEVSVQLTLLGVPNEWVTPTYQDLMVSLERALLATEARKNKESQIVFGIIDIDKFDKATEKYTTEHEVQLFKLKFQQIMLNYTKLLDGHLINSGGDEFSFITTRGIFERETRGYKYIPLLNSVKSQLGVTISIGVGFGRSAAEAGNHARLALRQSKELNGNVCYIVREDQSVIGPVDIITDNQYEKYDLSITDAELLEKAEKAGMSAAYMTKLMARVARHKKYDYTAQELADTLNITIRSAHRILLKWMDANLVDIAGEEKITYKGRPRRIYSLSFIIDKHQKENW